MRPDSSVNSPWLGRYGCGLLVWLVSVAIYAYTLAPTVTAEDSGELIAAAHCWGVAHPPGYPLWTMLCGTFMRVVPGGDLAWRANLFSAVCSSLSAVLVCMALRALGIRSAAAVAGALVWAFSGTLWSQSVITEVYGLNALLCGCVLWAVARWREKSDVRWLMVASLVFGLGMSNHPTIGFFAIAAGLWAVVLEPAVVKVRWLVPVCVIVFAVGLLPYAYLPLRAQADPPINWGNPATWDSFKEHVTRSQYGAIGPVMATEHQSLNRYGRQLAYAARVVAGDLTWPLAAIGVVGFALSVARRRERALLVALLVASCGLLYTWVANTELRPDLDVHMQVFLIPLALVGAMCIAEALDFIMHSAERRAGTASRFVVAGLAVMSVCMPLIGHWQRCNYRQYWWAYDHGQNILASMLPNALIFPAGDHDGFPLLYLTVVEGQRPDVLIADKYGSVDPAALERVAEERNVEVTHTSEADKIRWLVQHAGRPAYFAKKGRPPLANTSFVPVGVAYLLIPDGEAIDRDSCWAHIGYRNFDHDTAHDMGRRYILSDYYVFKALHELERGEDAAALASFAAAGTHSTAIREGLNNIGSALAEHGRVDQAIEYFERARAIDPYYITARWNLAQIYRDRSSIELCEEALDELLNVAPEDHRAYRMKGELALRVHHDPAAAQGWFLESLEREPYQPALWKLLLNLDGR